MDNQEVKDNLNIDEIDHLNFDSNEMSWKEYGPPNSRSMGNKVGTSMMGEDKKVSDSRSGVDIVRKMNGGEETLGGGVPDSADGEAINTVSIANGEKPGEMSDLTGDEPKLGEITPMMPPGYEMNKGQADKGEAKPERMHFSKTKVMNGDRLKTEAIDAIQGLESKLGSDQDAEAFEDEVFEMIGEFQGKETNA